MSEEGRLREKKVQFWVTEKELRVIDDRAKYCQLSRSVYLRKVSVDGFIIKRELGALDDINKIGLDIYQIARKVNQRGSVIEKDVDELRVQYEKMFAVVYGQILNG